MRGLRYVVTSSDLSWFLDRVLSAIADQWFASSTVKQSVSGDTHQSSDTSLGRGAPVGGAC
jgi:hypothetical protein